MRLFLQKIIASIWARMGWEVVFRNRSLPGGLPDARFYRPLFSPWHGYGEFKKVYESIGQTTLVSLDRLHLLWQAARHCAIMPGEFWECGVFKGGSARMLASVLAGSAVTPCLRLFDTFSGMPETDPVLDYHKAGDFNNTALEQVRDFVGPFPFVHYHQGFIPKTFEGCEDSRIALAHVDVDIYRSVLDSSSFIYPRLLKGGLIIYDDYGFPSCPGARKAVDEFYSDKPEEPFVLPTGQALVVKL